MIMKISSVMILLIVSGVAIRVARGTSHDVTTLVFGGEQNFAAFMSARDVTIERLHAIPVDSEHPYPRDALDLSCYRRESSLRLSPEQIKEVKSSLSQSSAYEWDSAKACLPDYGVLLTVRSDPEIRIALCFECDMLAVYVGQKTMKQINREDDFDSISPRLLAIARGVYPKDSELAKVKEQSR
jgi:hypothetical protein